MENAVLPKRFRSPLNRSGLCDLFNWITDTHLEDAIPGYAGLDIGPTGVSYDHRAAQLEGLSRLFWGAAFAYKNGEAPNSSDKLLAGLANGSDAEHPSYWGPVSSHDQRAVEMAPLAAALMEIPDLPEKLGPVAADNLFNWLSGIQNIDINPNNWRFFRILVMTALQRWGRKIDQTLLADELDFIDSQFLGGGWYGDNKNAGRDYYNGFAFHCYSLLYARWRMEEDGERCRTFIERARTFALRYRYWFDDDGAHIAYGRSLTYRFAPACFWPLLAEFGHPEMGMEELRGLWSRSLEWWLGREIFDPRGRVTIGYAYPNLLMSEFYNSPQSPLWLMKAFFPMALPESHPFWQSRPEACRYEQDQFADIEGKFVMQRKDGGVYMLAGAPVQHEMRNCVDKYGKFAYSSRHGLCVEAARWLARGNLGDNILALSTNGNEWFSRTAISKSIVEDGGLRTFWEPLPGCRVETRQQFTPDGEKRLHIIESDCELSFLASGHAVDAWKRGGIALDLPASGDGPAAVGKTLYSDIADAQGKWHRGCVAVAPNTNIMFPVATVPVLGGKIAPGKTILDTVLRYGRH